jgi:hypothetical protein
VQRAPSIHSLDERLVLRPDFIRTFISSESLSIALTSKEKSIAEVAVVLADTSTTIEKKEDELPKAEPSAAALLLQMLHSNKGPKYFDEEVKQKGNYFFPQTLKNLIFLLYYS